MKSKGNKKNKLAVSFAVGLSTQKWFGGALHFGKVTDTDIDAANGQKIWRVVYSDGDTSDYNILELRKILISELN